MQLKIVLHDHYANWLWFDTGEWMGNNILTQSGIGSETVGSATLSPSGSFVAGSYETFTLTYTAGFYGIDDSGSLKIVFRYASDQSTPQFNNPEAPNYVSVAASNDAVLEARFDPKGNVRPWDKCIYIKVVRGFLKEGDTIRVIFGDTSMGSPGMRIQTFCEDTFEFRVLVDAIATYTYVPVKKQPFIAIVPGPVDRYRIVVPSLITTGEPIRVNIKGEDRWGNPTNQMSDVVRVVADLQTEGLPEKTELIPGEFAKSIDGVVISNSGICRFQILSEAGNCLAISNPIRVVDEIETGKRAFWGDLHGQSEETIGSNSARSYFEFGRDRAFLDVIGHQGNDFQISDNFWADLNSLTAEFNEPGRFVTVPGYEWSGNTSLGGDRNVFFADEGHQICRSSKALVPTTKFEGQICPTATDLFSALKPKTGEVLLFAHCGGRYADIKLAHDGLLEPSIEIHSSWGTFEWLLRDAFEMGYRVGIVANSDGHKGRPGASYPGPATFGAVGGLTCFRTHELSRDAIFECLKKRHHAATTGSRTWLDVTITTESPGTVFHQDPAIVKAEGIGTSQVMMGDIMHLPEGNAVLRASISGNTPIVKVDLFNGLEHLHTIRPYTKEELGSTIRVIWQGAEYRGRFRAVNWDGTLRVVDNRIVAFQPVNFLNPDRMVQFHNEQQVEWQSITTGNISGIELKLADSSMGRILIETPIVSVNIDIADVGYGEILYEAGGLDRQLSICRLPDMNSHLDLEMEETVDIKEDGDNAFYLRVTEQDGNQAWSSPIYLFRDL